MNQKKSHKSTTLSKGQRRGGKAERVHHEPPSHRLDNFNPMKIAEGKRKEKRNRLGSRSGLENLSGMTFWIGIKGGYLEAGFEGREKGLFLAGDCFWLPEFVRAFLLIREIFNLIKIWDLEILIPSKKNCPQEFWDETDSLQSGQSEHWN